MYKRQRIYGFESYNESINYIALNYPNSPEGEKAEEMIENVMPLLSKNEFQSNDSSKHFKAIYQFVDAEAEEIDAFFKKLNEAITKIDYFELTTSKDMYNENTTFIVVHGLKSIQAANGFREFLKDKKQNINREHFGISSQNYQIVQIHKNLDEYLKSL